MQSHYVVTGAWFENNVDIWQALNEEYDVLDISQMYHEETKQMNDAAVFNEELGAMLIFHCSWGDSLASCSKLKVYTIDRNRFDDTAAEREWCDGVGNEVMNWVLENTEAIPSWDDKEGHP